MPRTRLQYTPVRRVRWATPAVSDEVILNVTLGDLANELIKKPLACLTSAVKHFPKEEYPPRYPRDAIAMRGLLEPTLLFDVVTHVLSEISVVPIVEGDDNTAACSKFDRSFAMASCANKSTGGNVSCNASGRVLQKIAMHLNEFGINSTSAFPISQLNGPNGFSKFECATLRHRVQSLSLRHFSFDASNGTRLEPQQYQMGTEFGSGSFVAARSQHNYRAAQLRRGNYSAATTRGLSSICVRRSLPHATHLPGHDYNTLDTWHSMLVGRRMTNSQGSRLFTSMRIRVPANKSAVQRSCCLKEIPRCHDMRTLATGRLSAAIVTPAPSASRLSLMTYSKTVEQLFHCRRQRTTPQSHVFDGNFYTRVNPLFFLRSSRNHINHISLALLDRTALVTYDQMALHVFANGVLESGLVADAVVMGFSAGGHVLQSASPLLATSCECPRAGVFLDSRMQHPTTNNNIKATLSTMQRHRAFLREHHQQHGATGFGRGVVQDVWQNQCVARFQVVAPHDELAIRVAQLKAFHVSSMEITQRLALLSRDPNTFIMADVDHTTFPMQSGLDIVLNIRPHMTVSNPLAADP